LAAPFVHSRRNSPQEKTARSAIDAARRAAAIMPVPLICIALLFMVSLGGCAAAGLASSAIEGVASVGVEALELTAVAANGSADKKINGDNPASADAEQVCGELALTPPMILEFRTDNAGVISSRTLYLAAVETGYQWQAVPNGADASGWRPADNIAKMDFQPPLGAKFGRGAKIYLAYVPAQNPGGGEANPRDNFDTVSSGTKSAIGSFRLDGRLYYYETIAKPPCFPGPL
ncbi:MAG: hypothetical protein ACREP6_12695, partial [Candidatus Binataceae bacterium]